ncbi:Gfo/Idh/MocA family protein [Haloferula chungangensis]|uniref:Gfo/Idh/MocA family protein n=1 Tax=Haloferula chungangensis TaxID=1048331 RepID=A0ABW2L6Z5_9BACT
MNTPLKGVCVGAGYFSRFQYESWQRIPEVTIVANCNRSVDKAEEIAKDYGIPRSYPVTEFAKMLDREEPDFVDIITPPDTHLELCRIAVEKGVHIICQKPLAPTWDETLELAELIKSAKGRFMVHENFRWQPWYREIKKILDAGTLGEFFHLAFRCRMGDGWGDDAYLARQPFFRDYKRLFLFETGVHFLDTFRYLAGEIDSIHALIARRNPVIKGEDSALVTCRFANCGTAVLDANRYNEVEAENPRYTFGTLRIDGSKGHLEMDLDGGITIKPLGEPSYEHIYKPSRENFAGDCVHALQEHFVACMLSGDPFESTVEDYLKSVQLVEAAYESAATDQVVKTQA